jgi:hypothetical protein
MFGNVLDKLDTWIGRNFLIASFFPFFIFAVVNALMFQFLLPIEFDSLTNYYSAHWSSLVSLTLSFLFVCAVLAFVTNPLIRLVVNMIRGGGLPSPAKRLLTAGQSRQRAMLEDVEQARGRESLQLKGQFKASRDRLLQAYAAGIRTRAISDIDSVTACRKAIAEVVWKADQRIVVDCRELERATELLEAALRANSAEPDDLIICEGEDSGVTLTKGKIVLGNPRATLSAAEYKQYSVDLKAAFNDLLKTIARLVEYARTDYTNAVNDRFRNTTRTDIFATAFGNKYAATAGFLDDRFNIDLDFILPMLQVIVQGDKDASNILAGAQQQLDFTIRMFVYAILLTAIWLFIAAWRTTSIFTVPGIGLAGLAATCFLYQAILSSFQSFGEVIRALCILKRFEILEKLHMPLPKTWDEEKTTWKRVNYQLQWDSQPEEEEKSAEPSFDLTYHHPGDKP